jgi:hypothetical protein
MPGYYRRICQYFSTPGNKTPVTAGTGQRAASALFPGQLPPRGNRASWSPFSTRKIATALRHDLLVLHRNIARGANQERLMSRRRGVRGPVLAGKGRLFPHQGKAVFNCLKQLKKITCTQHIVTHVCAGSSSFCLACLALLAAGTKPTLTLTHAPPALD